MSRFLVSGLAALIVGGCVDCADGDHYDCVVRYDPYYGYYNDCHLVRNRCEDRHPRSCTGGNCSCRMDTDCASDELCSAWGTCVSTRPSAPDSGSARGGGARTGAGGAAALDAGAPSEPDASAGASGGAGNGGAASANGGATSSSSGGATSSAKGGATTSASGGSTSSAKGGAGGTSSAAGGVSPNAGGTGVSSGGAAASSSGGAAGSSGAGNAATDRIHRLDFACTRDTQCGAGECSAGLCYMACESDTDCGTGDRCSVETGRRICMPDPNPAVRCDESAVCRPEQTCVNGSCHDPCSSDANCANLEDRCDNHLCFPDRRPIAECVLNVECAADLVCLDGRCVKFGGD